MVIAIVIFSLMQSNAQTNHFNNNQAISLEIGKTGLLYNLTYDCKFKNKNTGLRVGLGANFSNNLEVFTTGAGGYYLVGNKHKYLELGIEMNYLSVIKNSDDQKGISFFYPDYTLKTIYANANIGFRQYGKNTLFRIGVSPGFTKIGFLPGGYISFGLTF